MHQLISKEVAVERFAQDGHLFYPGQLSGIGDVTILCIGEHTYYAECTTNQFCNRLIDLCCMDRRKLCKFSYRTLGQRKLAPLVLHQNLVLVPFLYQLSDNRTHRTAFARKSSILTYTERDSGSDSTLFLKDRHRLDIPYSSQRVSRQLRNANHLLNKYVLRFHPSF